MNHRHNTIWLIIIASIVKTIIAITTELGNDEVYYRVYANSLQWNYFDHPPIVGWMVRLSTFNLFFDNEFTIRLGAILCSAGASWMMYKCGKKIASAFAGFLAAAIYTASIYGSIIAGTFILPDAPQMLCWTTALYLLLNITASKNISIKTRNDILLFGLVSGIALMCKIHSVFLWFGFGLFILFYQREWLKHWAIYAAALITVICFLPVIIWNFQNHFITFFYHGERVDVASGGLNFESMMTFIGGQIFYANPIVFFIVAIALFKSNYKIKPAFKRILILVSMPLILLATGVSLFKDLLPHWTGPAFSGLILLAACSIANSRKYMLQTRLMPFWITAANALLLIVVIGGMLLINFYRGTIGSKQNEKLGDGDFTLDMYGWKKMAPVFDSIYKSTHPTNLQTTHTVIVCDKWFPAAHIEYYIARPLQIPMLVIGPLQDIHQYHWTNLQKGIVKDSTDVYLIAPSNYRVEIESFAALKNRQPVKIDTVVQYRNKAAARKFFVYYFKRDQYAFGK